jgi:GTP-binding protein
LFVLDAAGVDGRDPLSDYQILVEELKRYDPELLQRPSCIVLNKCDLEESKDNIANFLKNVSHAHILQVSAQNGDNLAALKQEIFTMLPEDPK